jgi:hypothetical protein
MTGPVPDRGALSGPLAGVSFVARVAGAMALADLPYPRPGSEPAQIQQYFGQNAGPARLSAAGQAVSAGVSLLSPLYFVAEPSGWFIPAGRFSGLLVSGIAGARLARAAR